MGASNAMTVYLRWSHLPDRAFRALVYMALVSVDSDAQPRYFGGRESLIKYGLGRQIPDMPAISDQSPRANEFRKARAADYQAAKVAVGQLVKAGVIELSTASAKGQSAEYDLKLGAPTGYVHPTEQGTLNVRTGYVSPTEQGSSNVPQRREPLKGFSLTEEERTPKGVLSPTRNTDENTFISKTVNSPVNVAIYKNAQDFLSSLPDLGIQYLNRVPQELSPSQRVIAAAELARTEMAS